jgi:predicted nucleic acid-binding protein
MMQMPESARPRVPAALDTSFWTAACVAESEGYALKLFELHTPQVVVREIESEEPPKVRPKAVLFQQLRQAGLIQVTNPAKGTLQADLFHRGERAALELAYERKWHALINEQKAHDYGRDILGLQTVSAPEMLVTVVFAGFLGKQEALRMLRKLSNITHAQLMQDATRLIERAP